MSNSYESMKQKKIILIMKECNVDVETARVALDHARGSASKAIDLLFSEQCRFAFGREIREYR